MEPMTMAAMLGVQFLGNALGGLGQREQAKAQARLTKAENLVNKANTEAANTIRKANNELGAAVGSLNRFRQAANNRQIMRQYGQEQEQIQTNLSRAMSDLRRGAMEERLDTAFELGSLAAYAAAAGVGGGSKNVLNSTIRMTNARKQAALEQQGDQITYDALTLLTNTQADAYMALDSTLILDQLDLMPQQFIPQFVQKAPSVGQTLFNAAIQTVGSNPALTQQTLEGFRSTAPPRHQSQVGRTDFYGNVSLRV